MAVKNRNIVLCIVFSIISCGIYGLYWFVVMTDEMNAITPDDTYQTSGVLALVFTIISCGIYSIYWAYKMGCKIDQRKGGNNGILFLVLSIFGLGIINYCLLQDELNKSAIA